MEEVEEEVGEAGGGGEEVSVDTFLHQLADAAQMRTRHVGGRREECAKGHVFYQCRN